MKFHVMVTNAKIIFVILRIILVRKSDFYLQLILANNINDETTQQNEQENLEDDMVDNMDEVLENLNEQQMEDESRGVNEEQRLEITSAENFTTNSLFSMNSFDQTLEMHRIVSYISILVLKRYI